MLEWNNIALDTPKAVLFWAYFFLKSLQHDTIITINEKSEQRQSKMLKV